MTLTRNLGDSLMQKYRVRVNQINPGWVLTENEAKGISFGAKGTSPTVGRIATILLKLAGLRIALD